MNIKKRSFWFHYNKPESKKQNKPIISLHYNKQCIYIENIICNVNTKGRINKRQPRFCISGKAKNIIIQNNIAYID